MKQVAEAINFALKPLGGTPLTTADTMARARKAAGRSIELIEACIESLTEHLATSKTYSKDLASHLAWLTAQIVPVMAELRQQDKAVVREVARIPLEAIITHLKTLPESRRAEIAAELTGADAEEPLL